MTASSSQSRLRVTQIGEYVRYHACDRRLKLGYDNRREAKKLPQITRLFTPLDPVLQEAGREREDQWEAGLIAEGFQDIGRPNGDGITAWDAFVDSAKALSPGQKAFAREVAVEADIGGFRLTGQIDFVLVLWTDEGPRLRLVECKASRKDRTYHRAQVATYQMMVRRLLKTSGWQWFHVEVRPDEIDVRAQKPTIAGEPVATQALDDRVEAVVARIDEDTNQVQPILDLPPLDLANVRGDVYRLLEEDGPFERILDSEVDALDYQLEPKCDGCVFNVHCLPESARQRRLELLGLDPSTARLLRESGIRSLDALADLDPDGVQADQIRSQPGFTERLGHLVHRARVRRTKLPGGPDDTYDVEPLESAGYGRLPEHEIDGQALVRVYLNVDYDYVEDRIAALSAHVTTSDGAFETGFRDESGQTRPDPNVCEVVGDNGQTRPVQGQTLLAVQPNPWTGDYAADTASERDLIESFLDDLARAMRTEAEADRAPVHFYVWSRSDLTRLIEACSRSDSRLLARLNELLGSREDLEQIIYTPLSEEVRQRFAIGRTGNGLTVATSLWWFGDAFHWRRSVDGKPVYLDRQFDRDLFDFETYLHQHEDGSWANSGEGATKNLFEIRSRHFDTISAPYWHALWGTLPDPDKVDRPETARAIRTYQEAMSESALRALLETRVQALRWIEEHISNNRKLDKHPLDLASLQQFSLGVNDIGEAALNVIRLDHRVRYNEWFSGMLRPPADRVPTGRSLPLCNVQLVEGGFLQAELDLSGYDLSPEELRRRTKYGDGDFVRVTPCSSDPLEAQSSFEVLWGGRTCIVESIDWSSGTLQLSHIFGKQSRYVVPSFGPDWGNLSCPFEHATLDESPTAYVERRVDARLDSRAGSHVYDWFDPTDPHLPSSTGISETKRAQYEDLIETLRLPNGHHLASTQQQACLEGLETQVQLLLGPPGTGKTTTTGAAVLLRALAHHEAGDLMLVAASTHTALNRLLEAIDETLPFFQSAAAEAGFDFPNVKVAKVQSNSGYEPSAGNIEDTTARSASSLLNRYSGEAPEGLLILGGTTSAALKAADKLDEGLEADALVVDEASMLLFPHFLALATLTSERAPIMLAGDDRQLAPIVAHEWEEEDRPPTVHYQPYVSAYEAVRRLSTHPEVGKRRVTQSALRYTFRLPAKIRSLIEPVYSDDVSLIGAEHDATDEEISDPFRRAVHERGGLFLALHDERESKQHNPVEADIIEHLLNASDGLEDHSVALIAPHRAQCSLLEARFGSHPKIARGGIDTVNSFQGGECSTIIVSGTVSDPAAIEARAEFVLGLERSNVAFSRAEQRLIVIAARSLTDHMPADLEHYQAAQLWKRLRALCTHDVGAVSFDGCEVQLLTLPD